MQLESLHRQFDVLQAEYGDSALNSIYGAGCVKNPKVMFVFMNPTARNISAHRDWKGLRAPWLGTKNVWNIFHELGLLSGAYFKRIQSMKPEEWTADFANNTYLQLKNEKVFVTNLAKCTQLDARPLGNNVFKDYLGLMFEEITLVNPANIISFGNQVSSVLLGKTVSVGNYTDNEAEVLRIGGGPFKVYPTYYPVGQGRRNMPLAIKRIKRVLN